MTHEVQERVSVHLPERAQRAFLPSNADLRARWCSCAPRISFSQECATAAIPVPRTQGDSPAGPAYEHLLMLELSGGGGGIRTREGLASLPVFKTGAFDRSATPPGVGVGR